MGFIEEFSAYLSSEGISCDNSIVPVPLCAKTVAEALKQHDTLKPMAGSRVFVPEDRWNSSRIQMCERILAHNHRFLQVYARNCEVRRIEKPIANEFLERCHSYGDANCRYRYGLFIKRLTGEKCIYDNAAVRGTGTPIQSGTLVAVAEFSSARKWVKGEKTVRSCEWVRYASLPNIRVAGGMGKLLKAFISDVKPDDIMSYADLEWSDGSVYKSLGFELESFKEPVLFRVDIRDWERHPVHDIEKASDGIDPSEADYFRYYLNFGSAKYRLKLTDY